MKTNQNTVRKYEKKHTTIMEKIAEWNLKLKNLQDEECPHINYSKQR